MSSAATWLGHASPDDLLSAQPAVGAAVQQLRQLAAATTPGRTGELIAARVAQIVDGAVPAVVPTTDAEHAVVAVAEQFLVDVHGIDDAMIAALGTWYSDAEVVAIMFHLALVDGFTKFGRMFSVGDA